MIWAGSLDRRITLQRATETTNDFGEKVPAWGLLATVWAGFKPVSDGEKWRAGMVEAREFARFTIRYSSTVADLSAKDRLLFDGDPWSITGVKELGRRQWLEITAERVAA
ncbi:phage head closure protein [Jannaschia formosa]|uniref:phage head closure protein n=1 Tax=Jannaschia formosa TaxID=2259592 RepID=UPI000E1B6F84|nr:phage head closure protein [Jannaschia formosa]TFL16428.1 head-tail adaptor protein [Jannaschia formosa]